MATKKEPGLQEALIEIGKAVGTVDKDARNDHHGYKYASAEAVLRQVREACHAQGVSIVGSDASVQVEGANRIVRMSLTFAKGDEQATFCGLGEGKDSQDKATMKANTAALKYLVANAFLISWGDDPEATDENGKSTRAAGPRKPKATPASSGRSSRKTHEDAIASMTAETAESVRATIKADSSLSDEDFNALVAAFKAKQASL